MFAVASVHPASQAVPSWGSCWDVWLTYDLDSTVYCSNWKSSPSSIPLYLWGLIPVSIWICTWPSSSEWLPCRIMLFLTLSIHVSQVSCPSPQSSSWGTGWEPSESLRFQVKKKNTYRHIAKVTPDKLVARLAYANSNSRIGQPFSEAAQKVTHSFMKMGVKSQALGQKYLYSNCQDIYKTVGS